MPAQSTQLYRILLFARKDFDTATRHRNQTLCRPAISLRDNRSGNRIFPGLQARVKQAERSPRPAEVTDPHRMVETGPGRRVRPPACLARQRDQSHTTWRRSPHHPPESLTRPCPRSASNPSSTRNTTFSFIWIFNPTYNNITTPNQ